MLQLDEITRRRCASFAFVVTGIALSSCGLSDSGGHFLQSLTLPSDALDRRFLQGPIFSSSAQLTFSVKRTFPSLEVRESIAKQLGERGWRRCEARSMGWTSFEDRTGAQPLQIHRILEAWTSIGNDYYMLLSGEYRSKVSQGVPDNDVQIWLLLEKGDSKAATTLREMGYACR